SRLILILESFRFHGVLSKNEKKCFSELNELNYTNLLTRVKSARTKSYVGGTDTGHRVVICLLMQFDGGSTCCSRTNSTSFEKAIREDLRCRQLNFHHRSDKRISTIARTSEFQPSLGQANFNHRSDKRISTIAIATTTEVQPLPRHDNRILVIASDK
uniref:Uncharacterized protein n=1 Tax=Strigamia maritima TaxID=126957 RepID=T1J2I2_STRMM